VSGLLKSACVRGLNPRFGERVLTPEKGPKSHCEIRCKLRCSERPPNVPKQEKLGLRNKGRAGLGYPVS
jgi:hypothetical protein